MRGKKSKRKNLKSKQDTILLIVENSEVIFYNEYFRDFLQKEYQVKIEAISSGKAGQCEITNGNKMSKRVHASLLDDEYKAVFLMIDLDTKCLKVEQNHTCFVKLLNEYKPRYKINKRLKDRFYLFVVCNEIESWFLTIKKDTNDVYQDHKKELKNFLNLDSETKIVKKMVEELNRGKYQLDFSKNSSLQHFIKKLQEYNVS